jgi:PleD family two-component response regulator
MEKTKSVIRPKARVSRAQSGGVKRRPKAAKPTVNLDLYRANLPRMIDQIQEEPEVHSGRAAELKAELEKVTNTTEQVLKEVQELRNIVESLRENGQGEDVPVGAPAATKEGSSPAVRREESPGALPGTDDGLKKILIIDDDSTTINIISHFLQKENYRVSTSLSGVEGLKKAFKEAPDLILLDVMMPDLNGFQFLSIYRKDEENARTPVVILSSLSEEADVLKGLEIGAVDYITKPFSPQVLMAKIKKNLNSGP